MKISPPLAIVGALAILALALLLLLREPAPAPEFDSAITLDETVETTSPQPSPTAEADIDASIEQPAMAAVTDSSQAAAVEPGVMLSGWVGDASGSGLGGIEIEIENHGFDGEEIAKTGFVSNGSGDFLLENIVPGRQYRLEIRPQDSYAGYSLDSFTAADAENLRQIILARVELIDAEGMIVDTSHAPVADFELSVRSLTTQFPDRVIRSDSTGYFKLESFPAGELRIATNGADYYRIKGLKLRPDEYRNLTLMIDRGNYHLSGWVSDNNGAPLAQVQVTLKSAFATDDYHSFSYRSTVTDDNGGFEFTQLGGHRLTLGVYAPGFSTHISQHDFKSFADRIEIQLQQED